MNLQHAARQATMSHERQHETDTQLHGRWLLLARIVWFALVSLTLSVCMANLPAYFTELHTVCLPAACSFGQLFPEAVVALQHLGLSVGSYATFMVAFTVVFALVFFGTGGLIFWRKSDDWMALLFALILVASGTSPVLLRVGISHSVWRLPILLVGNLLFLWVFLAFTLFPNGRFVPRWTRWLLVVFSLLLVILTVFELFTKSLTVPWIAVAVFLLFLSLYAGLVIAQLYRYRHVSTLVQRQQTKWVVYGFTANVVVIAPVLLPMLIFPGSLYSLVFPLVATCSLFLTPFTMGIAILRYRLWDIDVLIHRTLVYATLTGVMTGMLALVYLVSIFLLQALFRGLIHQENEVASVISTLVIYALFQPVRSRLQAIIDRRFYRRKYNAARTLAAFSATLRHEVDLDDLSRQLVAVVQETMQPSHVSLWLRPTAPDRKDQATWSSPPPAP